MPETMLLGLLIAGTTGMGGLLIFWWAALLNGYTGHQPWAVVLIFNRFNEQWAEGVLFHCLGAVVLMAWIHLWRRNRSDA